MATLIEQPTILRAAGEPPKTIEEYVGRVNSGTGAVSVARMKSPQGWSEPGQTPEFDEYTVVLAGALRVRTTSGELIVRAGQAVLVSKGEWVQYATPDEGGAEYMAICLPAFSPDLVQRDDGAGMGAPSAEPEALTPNDRLARQLRFLWEADKLKAIVRQNTLADGSRRETDAEHSWHFALMAVVLAEHAFQGGIDVFKVIKMALIHDIVEIDAGDVFLYHEAARAEQTDVERAAAERLFGLLPPDQAAELRALWEEFEALQTPEARFAKSLDRLNPLMLNCRARGVMWKRHGIADAPVRRLNQRDIEPGAPALWELAQALISDAVAKGNLPSSPY